MNIKAKTSAVILRDGIEMVGLLVKKNQGTMLLLIKIKNPYLRLKSLVTITNSKFIKKRNTKVFYFFSIEVKQDHEVKRWHVETTKPGYEQPPECVFNQIPRKFHFIRLFELQMNYFFFACS